MAWPDVVIHHPSVHRIKTFDGFSDDEMEKMSNRPIYVSTRFLKNDGRKIGLRLNEDSVYELVSFFEINGVKSNVVAVNCYDDCRTNRPILPVALITVDSEQHADIIKTFKITHKLDLQECFLEMDFDESDDSDSDCVGMAPVSCNLHRIDRKISLGHLEKMNSEFMSRVPERARKDPGQIIQSECCAAQCTLLLCRAAVMRVRSNIMELWSEHKRVTDIKKIIRLLVGPMVQISDTEMTVHCTIDGIEVCVEVFASILGVSSTSLLALMLDSTVSDNGSTIEHGLIGRVSLHDHTLRDVVAGAYFIDTHCQDNPSGGLLMPPGLSKSQFIRLVAPSSQFRLSTLKRFLKKTVFFRTLDSHLRCNACQHLGMAAKPNCTWDVDDIREGLELRKAHFKEMLTDRLTIEMAETVSRNEPWNLLVLKMDGMGKHSTKLPHLVLRAKHVSDVSRSSYELFATQAARHSTNNTMYCNVMFGNLFDAYKGGTSTYVSHMLYGLSKLDCIPPALIVVLDNARPNKSEEMFAFIGWLLIQFPTLDRVYLVFQLVGHTHNSVDAVFGNVVQKLTTIEAETPGKMENIVCDLSGVTDFLQNSPVFDFKPLTQHCEEYVNRINQQHFVVFRDEKGVVKFKCSRYIRCSKYFRLEGETEDETVFPVFKKDAERMVQQFTPIAVVPNYANIMAGCQSILKSSVGFLSDADVAEYESIIKDALTPPPPVTIHEIVRLVQLKMRAPIAVSAQGEAHTDSLLQYLKRMHLMDQDTWKPIRYKKKQRVQ